MIDNEAPKEISILLVVSENRYVLSDPKSACAKAIAINNVPNTFKLE